MKVSGLPWDVERIRKDFPILHEEVHGKPLVYLDNAATSQKPHVVIEALVDYYAKRNSNVHRGLHLLSERATEAYEEARARIQRFLNAAHSREIIFVRGTTEGINLVAQTYGRRAVGAGDEVVITALEHHSNIVPWQMLCEEKHGTLRVAPINDAGEVDFEAYEALLGERTREAPGGLVGGRRPYRAVELGDVSAGVLQDELERREDVPGCGQRVGHGLGVYPRPV